MDLTELNQVIENEQQSPNPDSDLMTYIKQEIKRRAEKDISEETEKEQQLDKYFSS